MTCTTASGQFHGPAMNTMWSTILVKFSSCWKSCLNTWGVEEAMIGIQQPGHLPAWATTHISASLWYDGDRAREHMAKRLAEYVIPGVKFCDQYEAEKFKLHMEQRLAWKRLGGSWA